MHHQVKWGTCGTVVLLPPLLAIHWWLNFASVNDVGSASTQFPGTSCFDFFSGALVVPGRCFDKIVRKRSLKNGVVWQWESLSKHFKMQERVQYERKTDWYQIHQTGYLCQWTRVLNDQVVSETPCYDRKETGNTDLQVTTYNHPMSNKKLAKYQMGILAVRRKPTLEFPWQLVHTSYCWWTNPWTGWYTKCMAFFWRPLSWNMSQVTHCSPPRLEPRIHCGVPLLANQTQDSPRNHRVMNGSLMVWRKMWRIDENSKLWFAVLSMKPSVVKQLLLFTWNDMSKEALCLFLSSKHILIYNHHTYIQTMWIDM